MELKEGMYVRTKKGIFQITNDKTFIENKIEYIAVNGRYTCIDVNTIIKASNNVIDLIEVGDFISYIYPSGLGILGFEDVKVTEGLLNILQNGKNNHEYTIKSIVTKEQFESMEYSLEG